MFTASERLKQKLDQERDLVSHSVPPGNLPVLIDRAIDLHILTEGKRRSAARVSSDPSTKRQQSSKAERNQAELAES